MSKEGLVAPNALFTFIREYDGEKIRIDRYLSDQFPLYSRSFFKKIIEEGFVSVNDTIINKQSTPVAGDDTIVVRFPPERHIESEDIRARNLSVDIVYEHDHFFIISKPAGLIVHPPHTKSKAVTLVDWLLLRYKELERVGYVDRPGIVHRLDKETSGLMIIPRTNIAHKLFSDQFKDRTIKKTYLAVVQGHPERIGTITFPIGRHPQHKTKMYAFPEHDSPYSRTNAQKRTALTHYKVKEYFNDSSLVEVYPVTGRTHQIRVQFAALGHSLIGDPVYGTKSKKIKRHALHAHRLTFNFMGEAYSLSSNPPADMQILIEQEGRESHYRE